MGIRIGIGNILIGQSSPTAWQDFWKGQDILGLYFKADLAAGKIYNCVKGRETEYLTVAGTLGSETYQCPNIQDYKDADTDFIWFKTDATQRTVTTAELVGYDLQHTPVKYASLSPNAIEVIMILASNLSPALLFRLHNDFQLPIMWSGAWVDYGYAKSNRNDTVQNVWTPEVVIYPVPASAAIAQLTPTLVKITFDNALDEASVPAASAFTLAGKTISTVAVAGAVVTLTVTVAYAYGDAGITVGYTKPVSNPLKGTVATGNTSVVTFAGQAVTNGITYPTILDDGHTALWTDNADLSTITKDGSNLVSEVRNKLGGSNKIAQDNLSYRMTWASNKISPVAVNSYLYGSFTNAQPVTIYAVLSIDTWQNYYGIFDGMTYSSGSLQMKTDTLIAAQSETGKSIYGNIDAGAKFILRLMFNGTGSKIQINDGAAVTGDAGTGDMDGFYDGGLYNHPSSSGVSRYEYIVRPYDDYAGGGNVEIYNFLKAKHGL